MSDLDISNDLLEIIKEGSGEEIILLSPFFPINIEVVKDFFLNLETNNHQFIFSSLKNDKSDKNFEAFTYKNILDFYIKKIKLLPNKKITLISFGIFTNVFLELALNFKNKIKSVFFFEPDFSNILFKSIFEFKRLIFKNKFIFNFYLDNEKSKIDKNDFDNIEINYLKKFYDSLKENTNIPQLKELINFLPDEIDQNSFKNKVLDKLSNKDKSLILKYYVEREKRYILNTKSLTQNNRVKLRNILIHFGLLQNVVIYWYVMSRESWPLAQILEEYKIPVNHLDKNIYFSMKYDKENLGEKLKKYL